MNKNNFEITEAQKLKILELFYTTESIDKSGRVIDNSSATIANTVGVHRAGVDRIISISLKIKENKINNNVNRD